MTKTVWTYWNEIETMPGYIRLCIKTMQAHLPEFILLTDSNLRGYLNGIGNLDKFERIETKADYIKAVVLQRYGGIFIDADTIVFRRFDPVFDLMFEKDFVVRKTERGWSAVNFMGTLKKKVATDYLVMVENVIFSTEGKIKKGGALGARLLTQVTDRYKSDCEFLSGSVSMFEFDQWEEFLHPCMRFENKHMLSCVLYNRMFPDWFKQMDEEDILGREMLISKMFKEALR